MIMRPLGAMHSMMHGAGSNKAQHAAAIPRLWQQGQTEGAGMPLPEVTEGQQLHTAGFREPVPLPQLERCSHEAASQPGSQAHGLVAASCALHAATLKRLKRINTCLISLARCALRLCAALCSPSRHCAGTSQAERAHVLKWRERGPQQQLCQ